MVALCCVFSHTPCPAGYVPPVCSDIPGCGPLFREWSTSVAAELHSGTKWVWMRSLICRCFDTEPLSICLSLFIFALIVPPTSAPPSVFLCITRAHKYKYTPVFAKGERERWRETTGKHTTEMAPFTFLFCFIFFEWVLTHDKVPGSWGYYNPPVLLCVFGLVEMFW